MNGWGPTGGQGKNATEPEWNTNLNEIEVRWDAEREGLAPAAREQRTRLIR